MTRRKVLGLLAGAVTLAIVVVATGRVWPPAEEWSADGPLILPNSNGITVRYEVGHVFTDDYQRIKLSGDQPGVLEKVELVGPGMDHFEVLGVLIAGPGRKTGALTAYDGFSAHPTHRIARGFGELVPAEGARLPAGGELGMPDSVLQIGLKVIKPGLAIRSGVRLYYTVGGEKYVAFQQGSMVLCPPDMTDDECEDAMVEEWPEFSDESFDEDDGTIIEAPRG